MLNVCLAAATQSDRLVLGHQHAGPLPPNATPQPAAISDNRESVSSELTPPGYYIDYEDDFLEDWSGDELLSDDNSLVSELDNYPDVEDFISDSK